MAKKTPASRSKRPPTPAQGAHSKKGAQRKPKPKAGTRSADVATVAAPPAPRPGSRAAQQAERLAQQDAFLEAFKSIGSVLGACRRANIGRRTHYDWLESDPGYAQRFVDARDDAGDMLEQEARRRAVAGVEEPVYGPIRDPKSGKVIGHGTVGTIRKYSDVLLIALLNANLPDKFKRRHEHSGPKGGAIPVSVSPVQFYLPDNGRRRNR